VQGQLLRLGVEDEVIRLRSERALGRLARGLERIRQERNLSQAELAALAGVTPSAISQAEGGHRGLSLDTLVALAERLGTGVDDLLVSDSAPGYVLARRDRTGAAPPYTALLDDPSAGLRAYLIRLGPEEEGVPPLAHKGAEMVLVSSGLVQVRIGSETPVMRAGDALLATASVISGWRNLMSDPARLFWILRD
jgi:transcriptional regulator with XRE-family HTH domain